MHQKPFHLFMDEYIQDFIKKYGANLENYSLYDTIISQVEKSLISAVLISTKNNQSKAAAMLGISRVTLKNKIASLGIKIDA